MISTTNCLSHSLRVLGIGMGYAGPELYLCMGFGRALARLACIAPYAPGHRGASYGERTHSGPQ